MFSTSTKTVPGKPSIPLLILDKINSGIVYNYCLNSISQMVWPNLNHTQYIDCRVILGKVFFFSLLGSVVQITLYKDGRWGTARQCTLYITALFY